MPSIFASADTDMLYGGSNLFKTASLRSCANRDTAFLNPPNLVKNRWCQLSCQSGVAYNAKFDFSFLQTGAMKNGISISNPAICALELARTAFPGRQSYKLMDLAKDMNIDTSDAHRSLADCKKALTVFIRANMNSEVKCERDILQITDSEFIPFDHPTTPLDLRCKSFCFTGRFVFGEMEDIESAIIKFGGYSANLTRKTDYVVVGSYDNNTWDDSTHSKIINQALLLRESGSAIQVISERVWLENLNATKMPN